VPRWFERLSDGSLERLSDGSLERLSRTALSNGSLTALFQRAALLQTCIATLGKPATHKRIVKAVEGGKSPGEALAAMQVTAL
jgi:hypothetical protein